MSWTIQTSNASGPDIMKLHNAIRLADSKNIIVFCSASEQWDSLVDDYYPGESNSCIKIGAATETGEICAGIDWQGIDFLLPGENVQCMSGNVPLSYHSRSSIATGFASGLAALLLYCNKLVAPEDGDGFKGRLRMLEAFGTMSGSPSQKFPQVARFFKPVLKCILCNWGSDESKEWREALFLMVNRIKVNEKLYTPPSWPCCANYLIQNDNPLLKKLK